MIEVVKKSIKELVLDNKLMYLYSLDISKESLKTVLKAMAFDRAVSLIADLEEYNSYFTGYDCKLYIDNDIIYAEHKCKFSPTGYSTLAYKILG